MDLPIHIRTGGNKFDERTPTSKRKEKILKDRADIYLYLN